MTPSPGDREKDRDTPGTDAEAGEALLSLRGKDGSAEKAKGKQRKAYTITKARERWTDSEHERFLQALKRYGRAWRKIEEHIGTKTAVQIRSHAQKFFSKLQREQSGSGAGMEDSSNLGISIPPPRPKRKPAHPYPRKHETDSQEPEQSRQSDRDASHPRDSLPSHNPTSRAHSRPQQLHDSFSPRPQLPDGFPALDTRLEPSLSQVLETAAIAAANAWSEVVAGAGSKIRQQLQAHVASHAGIAAAQPFFGMPQQSGAASLPYQLSGLQGMQGPSHPMGRHEQSASQPHSKTSLTRYDMSMPGSGWTHAYTNGQSAQDSPAETTTLENDRDSACSKQYSASRSLPTVLDRQRSTAFKITPGTHIQSAKAAGAGVSEARLGRPAWNLTTHTTQAHPQTVAGHTAPNVAPPRSLPRTASAGALPPPGQGTGAAINLNALKTQGSGGQASKPENRGSSVGQSMTPQMAHFYRQAAAHDPENRVTGGSGGEQGSGGSGGGSTGKLDPRRSDKGSNNGNASTSEEDARAEGSGSDNGGQENAQAGGSGDGKGSDDGSNSPAELTQNSTKSAQPSEGDKSATPVPQQQQQQQAGATFRYPGGIDPSLLAHASASLQNQQLLAQTYSGSHLQTSFLAGMNPQTLLSQQQVLANYQQQALSAWAASAHQQQQAKAAALKATTGATTWPTAHQQAPPSKSNSSRAAGTQEQRPGSAADTLQQKASGKLTSISKRSSGGASMDIFRSPSSMSIPLFAPSSSAGTGGSGRLGEESSGFQPYSKKQDSGYSKKHSMPLASLPPSKRFAAADASGSRPSSTDTRQGPAPGLYTPFGSSKIQGS